MPKKTLSLIILLLFYTNNITGSDPVEPDPIGDFKIQQNGNYLLNLPQYYFNHSKENFSLFRYYVNEEPYAILNYPNKLEYVKFNDEILEFDDQTILPAYSNWSLVTIYTSKEKTPLLMDIFGYYGYTFYSPDPETGKWKNYLVNKFNEYKVIDDNGVSCYKFDPTNDYSQYLNNISHEFEELSRNILNCDPCDDTNNLTDPPLKLSIKVIDNK